MEERFAAMQRSADPIAWAKAAYRLALAKTEQPTATPEQHVREALALYEQASEVLTIERAPVEHARLLNAAGSANRMLGDRIKAIQLFRTAAEILTGRGSLAEEAAILNNLGLALTESGRLDEAIEAFAQSSALLPSETEEHGRTFVATAHNLAQAFMARGGVKDYEQAISTLEEAEARAASIDAPMHRAMLSHSLGVARKALASLEPAKASDHIDEAVGHFERSLGVFTSVGFPLQHAIAKHNLGHALASRSDLRSLQSALVNYEDALNIFDVRLHRAHWNEAFENARVVEARLQDLMPGATRSDHTAALLGSMDETDRLVFIRQRLAQIERLPEKNRMERLTEFAYSVVTQPAGSFVSTLQTIITVLMELPDSLLKVALRAQLAAHAMLDPHDQRAADFVLDEAINACLFGPQRIRVRDLLEEIGWERP